MSVESKPYYFVVCDWDGCDANAQEGGEYSAWSDASHAVEDAENADWLHYVKSHVEERVHLDGRRERVLILDQEGDYCPRHWKWNDDEDEQVPGYDWQRWLQSDLNVAVGRALNQAMLALSRVHYRLDSDGIEDRKAIDYGISKRDLREYEQRLIREETQIRVYWDKVFAK